MRFVECYYCAAGSIKDILKLFDVYGNIELDSGGLANNARVYDQECGKDLKKSLKIFNCPFGCVFAEYVDKAAFAGCARNNYTYQLNEQQFRVAICNSNRCNKHFKSTRQNRPKSSKSDQSEESSELTVKSKDTSSFTIPIEN
ncbi:hypothetical protein M3Y97_00997100 [Aphelenchoides bicaudatus]|nr:hypothetical protein M3Y97_00997100 [Aphelenchoides bicaudatus]